MTDALGAPKPATVIAIGLNTRNDQSRQRFTELLGSTLAHTCHIQPAGEQDNELAFTAIVPDSSQTLSLLRRLLSIQEEFGQTHPDCDVRFVIHHGLVFPATKNYIGAALRSAHSRRARLPGNILQAATTDFADYAGTWNTQPITFGKLPKESEIPGLLAFSIFAAPSTNAAVPEANEEAFLHHLTTCLAAHLGPFAEVIVDATRRSSASPQQLIEELASEISEPKAQDKFRSDALAFISGTAA